MSERKQTIFLDTSVQIERVLTESRLLEKMETVLSSPDIEAVTTFYVWMEFQRTIVDDYVHIHQTMHKHEGWGATIAHLLDGPRSFRPRSAVRCTKIIGRLYRQSYQDWAFAHDILAEQIERGLREQFWHNVIPLTDPITCDLVKVGVIRQNDNSYVVASTCRKEQATCHLPEFLHGQQPKLNAIADYLASHPNAIKGQERVRQLLAAIIHDPRAALGQGACWPLGDLIIALQVPTDAQIWTLDPDFVALPQP
ncbi:MAG: hypothetical protein R3C14_37750 [Caldilineaceae bacterium]